MSEYIEHDQEGISAGIVEKKFFTFAEPPNDMVLENGARFGPVTLAYETYGELNADKSNVVLIPFPEILTPPAIIRKKTKSPAGGILWSDPAKESIPVNIL
jgi:homoserine acetyltransferase